MHTLPITANDTQYSLTNSDSQSQKYETQTDLCLTHEPQEGKEMNKVYTITSNSPQPLETSGILLGQVIHSDYMSRDYVIVSESGSYGQDAISSDGKHKTEIAKSALGQRSIPFWRETEVICTAEWVEHLKAKHAEHMAKEQWKRKEAHEKQERANEMGLQWLAKNRPEWADHVIVAELQQDESDIMTDYFASKTVKTLVLAWSRHKRDLFPEMRKAARRCPDLPTEWTEHREKYSMGKGYYLSEGITAYSGWTVRKRYHSEVVGTIGAALMASGTVEGVSFV
jgi:hypothetical protein